MQSHTRKPNGNGNNTKSFKNKNRMPLDEETALLGKAKQGDIAARNKLIVQYTRLSATVARRQKIAGLGRFFGIPPDDLMAYGNMGLFNAIRLYDPNRGASFSTYAYVCIKTAIYSAMRKENIMPVSRRFLEVLNATKKELTYLEEKEEKGTGIDQEQSENYSLEELRHKLRDQQKIIDDVTKLASLDADISYEDGRKKSLMDFIGAEDERFLYLDTSHDITWVYDQLERLVRERKIKDRDRNIFVQGMIADGDESLTDIGERNNMFKQQVAQIINKVMRLLRLSVTTSEMIGLHKLQKDLSRTRELDFEVE